VPLGAGVKKRADGHVAADAGKDVEIAKGHGITSVARVLTKQAPSTKPLADIFWRKVAVFPSKSRSLY
jgi:hypothetical protein